MYLRIVKARGGQGVQHEYIRLVEAYREDGKNKQRTVCNLGRKDLLTAHLDSLIRLLRGESAPYGDQVASVQLQSSNSKKHKWSPFSTSSFEISPELLPNQGQSLYRRHAGQ